MKILLAMAATAALPFLAGCIVVHDEARVPAHNAPPATLANLTTAELETLRAQILAQIAAIEREVELKGGLPMSVFIADDRAQLGDLQQEASAIGKELARRSGYSEGDGLRARL